MDIKRKQKPTICVVGGSAAGMTGAIFAARAGADVFLVEGNDKLGRKIYATGNGRCNYFNVDRSLSHFHTSGDPAWIAEALGCREDCFVLDFFRELGLLSVVSHGGYYYPENESAATVVCCLTEELKRLHVEVVLSDRMRTLQKTSTGFQVRLRSGRLINADAVLLAMGGSASPKFGSDGSGYYYAKNFGHKIITPLPALCPLKLMEVDASFSLWAGARVSDASIDLIVEDKEVAHEKGEILFTNYGISGIPVFQIAGRAAIALSEKKKVRVRLDLKPLITEDQAKAAFSEWISYGGSRTFSEQLSRIFPSKVVEKLACSVPASDRLIAMTADTFWNALDRFKRPIFEVIDTMGFEQAQVSSGGVCIEEVSPTTMESILRPGLFFAGELLDVYGDCGGYNLQFAITSGAIAGTAACNVLRR